MPLSEPIIETLLFGNILLNVVLGVLIFIRAYRQPFARFFIIVLFCVVGWTVGDLLVLYAKSPAMQDIGRHAFYVVPMGVPPCLWFFSLIFPEGRQLPKRAFLLGGIFSVGCSILAWRFIDGIGRLRLEEPMNLLIPHQPGFALYGVYLSVFFGLTYVTLFAKIRHTRGVARTQIIYTFCGVLVGSSLAVVSNVSLPVMSLPQYIWLGPIFTMVGVSLIALAVVRYHLFDIRLFVVRAIAYLTTLFLVTVLFVAPFVLIANAAIGIPLSHMEDVIVILLAVCMLYVFLYVKAYFDRATHALFLRNFYNTSDVLDKLSDILVRTSDLEQLKDKTAGVLADVLQPQFVRYVLHSGQSKEDGELASALAAYCEVAQVDIVETDTITHVAGRKLGERLRESNIAVAAELRTTHENLGYVVLGHKRSGELYSDRDKQLLRVSADEIAISLQNALRFEKIQRFAVTLQEEVDEKTRELRRKNKRLVELDDIKDDFISMASHQLRTPLTSVKGYLSMVLEGDAGKLTRDETMMLKQAYASSQRMVFLITDLLNVSRLKTGKFVIDAVPTNLRDVVKQELAQLRETAAAKNLELTAELPKSFPELLLDEVKTRQVIMNFVDNAIYYTPQGGRIKVKLVDKPSSVELRVVDNGIGVPRSEQHHLFTKFYRATNARTARPDGTGLGLFMAQKVIVAQGGSIIFKSQEGQGSTFGFSFPKSRAVAKKATTPQPQPKVKSAPEPAATH